MVPVSKHLMIRAMTAGDSMTCGSGRCPVTCEMRVSGESDDGCAADGNIFAKVNPRLVELAGTTALLALDGNLAAGFVSLFPVGIPEYDFCQDAQIADAEEQLPQLASSLDLAGAALRIRCLAVRSDYRGHGLGLALIAALKSWAREHGFGAIVANGNVYSGLSAYQWLVAPKPPRPFWERAGFCVSAFEPLCLPAMSDDASARAAFDWYLSDAYPATLPRDIAPDSPNWRDVFRDYTMIWTA